MPRIALIYALLLLVLPCKASGPRAVVYGNPQVRGDTTFFGELYQLLSTVTSVVSMETTENINLYVETTGSDTNTCTTGYGITLDSGATVVMSTNTGITGTTADATMNGGTTDLTWATDLAANGDVVVNVDNDTIIKRSD